MIAFDATWLRHISRGPYWDKVIGYEYRNCRKNWWTNLLYLNNYIDRENMVSFGKSYYVLSNTIYRILVLPTIVVLSSRYSSVFGGHFRHLSHAQAQEARV